MYVETAEHRGYLVSATGEVVSIKTGKWVTLKGSFSKDGYHRVCLWFSGKPKTIKTHRLVAAAFLGTSSLPVNHRNGVKTDNHLDNLEYCSISENNAHSYRTGLKQPTKVTGTRNGQAKYTRDQVEHALSLKGKTTQRAAAELTGMSHQYVGHLWRGKYRTRD